MDTVDWKQKVNQFKLPLGLSLIGIVLIVGGIFTSGLHQAKPKDFPKESLVSNQKVISVDISGAVIKPGVYQLPEGSRITDAVSIAGGFAEAASGEYISKYLNMAQKLSDGSKIYVPIAGENAAIPTGYGGSVAGANTQAKININTATEPELDILSGIGPVTAAKIVSGRPYQQIEDLFNKKIVSKAVFEKIKEQLVVY